MNAPFTLLRLDSESRKGKEDMIREFVISTEREDSHKTILRLGSWDIDDFNKAGAFYYQHQTGAGAFTEPNPDNALGPAIAYIEKGQLIGQGKFEPESLNPLAAKIMGKVDYGTLKSTSVGFIGLEAHWGDEERNENPTLLYFTKSILKEWSIVHIASNPDAIKRAYEPMEAFILKMSEDHKSEGFKRDVKHNIMRHKFDFAF